jgi:hypothetical protein
VRLALPGNELAGSAGSKRTGKSSPKKSARFGGLADATEPGESSGAVLPEVAVLKEAAREAAN